MRRREFLSGAAAASAAPALTACGERVRRPDGVLYGRAVSQTPPGTPWDDQWAGFRARIAENPSIDMDYFNRGELGNESQMMHDIRRGRAHVGGMSLQGVAVAIPELSVPMAPYLFDSQEEVDFVYDNFLYDVSNAIAERSNLYILQWVEVGWTNIYAQKPLFSPDDAAGLKARTPPNPATFLFAEAIGMDPIPLGQADLVPALQTGLVNAGLSGTVFHYFVTRAFASDFMITRHSYDTGAVVLNRDWYEAASDEQRATIDAAWGSSAEARQGVRDLEAFCLAAMREEGIAVHELSEEQRAEWAARTRPTHERIVEQIGGDAPAVYQAILDGKAAFKAQSEARA
ncbi:MAG: TRAP transporter substrate-binding protein DctP [Caulobacterales bacterium]|nr:TRAP transporter substrate-binding protein DctP [Caulobacterales bacterium]